LQRPPTMRLFSSCKLHASERVIEFVCARPTLSKGSSALVEDWHGVPWAMARFGPSFTASPVHALRVPRSVCLVLPFHYNLPSNININTDGESRRREQHSSYRRIFILFRVHKSYRSCRKQVLNVATLCSHSLERPKIFSRAGV